MVQSEISNSPEGFYISGRKIHLIYNNKGLVCIKMKDKKLYPLADYLIDFYSRPRENLREIIVEELNE